MQSVEDRLTLLEEAHVSHRQALRDIQTQLGRLFEELGIDKSAPRQMGPSGVQTFAKRFDRLERGGLSWTTQEALASVAKLTKLSAALQEIFDESV